MYINEEENNNIAMNNTEDENKIIEIDNTEGVKNKDKIIETNNAERLEDEINIESVTGGSIFQKEVKGAKEAGLIMQSNLLKGDRYIDWYTGKNYSVKEAKKVVAERQAACRERGVESFQEIWFYYY